MILTIAAQKGGVGKTTTTAAVAQALGQKKKNRVLVIDFDGQKSLSTIYGADPDRRTIYNVVKGECHAAEAIQKTRVGDIIPGSEKLYGLDIELNGKPGRDMFLKRSLEEIRDIYTHIIIDTAPGMGTGLIQALTASDGVIIPIQCNTQAYKGLMSVIETIDQVQEYCNNDLQLLGVVITKYQPRTKLTRDYENLISQATAKSEIKLLKTRIRQGIAVEEAQALRRDLYEYAPKSKPAEDYMSLIRELKL